MPRGWRPNNTSCWPPPEIPPATKKIRVKALGPEVRRATKRVRTMNLPGAGGAAAGADDDDEFAQGPMETFLKRL